MGKFLVILILSEIDDVQKSIEKRRQMLLISLSVLHKENDCSKRVIKLLLKIDRKYFEIL